MKKNSKWKTEKMVALTFFRLFVKFFLRELKKSHRIFIHLEKLSVKKGTLPLRWVYIISCFLA